MANFKRSRAFHLLSGALLAAALVTGCFRPRAHDPKLSDGTELANFAVASVKGSADLSGKIEGTEWPKLKLFTFTVCLNERKSKVPVQPRAFGISGDALSPKLAQTDASGCLSWQEEIKFNYLADEAYLPLTRQIESVDDVYGGRCTVHLAIDPWNFSGKAKEVVNLDDAGEKAQVPAGQLADSTSVAEKLSGTAAAPKLITLSKFTLSATGEANAALTASGDPKLTRTLELAVEPKITITDMNKARIDLSAKGLALSVNAALVAVVPQADGSSKRYLAWKLPQTSALESLKNQAEMMGASFKIEFVPVEIQTVHYQLLVRVASPASLLGLQPFEGIFEIGSHAQLLNSSVLPERMGPSNAPGSSFSLEAEIEGLETLPAPAAATPPVTPAEPTPN